MAFGGEGWRTRSAAVPASAVRPSPGKYPPGRTVRGARTGLCEARGGAHRPPVPRPLPHRAPGDAHRAPPVPGFGGGGGGGGDHRTGNAGGASWGRGYRRPWRDPLRGGPGGRAGCGRGGRVGAGVDGRGHAGAGVRLRTVRRTRAPNRLVRKAGLSTSCRIDAISKAKGLLTQTAPRACGDGPSPRTGSRRPANCSPRVRGWPLRRPPRRRLPGPAPRACGDGPALFISRPIRRCCSPRAVGRPVTYACSPRAQGWPRATHAALEWAWLFPACAGMAPVRGGRRVRWRRSDARAVEKAAPRCRAESEVRGGEILGVANG
ncbi:hypothetical protein GA0115257_110017 [Streptomyces sp. LcepLS]|nr:hypothetical protein GA0115257_110017 [Streptomyces sp. LcepLS]